MIDSFDELLYFTIQNPIGSIIITHGGCRYEKLYKENNCLYSKISYKDALVPKKFFAACMKALGVREFDDSYINFDSLHEIVNEYIDNNSTLYIIISVGDSLLNHISIKFIYLLLEWDRINFHSMKNNAKALLVLDLDT